LTDYLLHSLDAHVGGAKLQGFKTFLKFLEKSQKRRKIVNMGFSFHGFKANLQRNHRR